MSQNSCNFHAPHCAVVIALCLVALLFAVPHAGVIMLCAVLL